MLNQIWNPADSGGHDRNAGGRGTAANTKAGTQVVDPTTIGADVAKGLMDGIKLVNDFTKKTVVAVAA